MKIFGLDFTSSPSRKKPITCASCELKDNLLQVRDPLNLNSFVEFEELLRLPGPWLGALDFPFGLPKKLLANLGWPETWEGYIETVASIDKAAFEQTLVDYCKGRPAGDKHHLLISAERSKEKKRSADRRRYEQEIDISQRLARRTTDARLLTA